MLSRNEHTTKGTVLPKEWTEKVEELLNSLYKSDCTKNNKKFEAYGHIYDNELLVIISLSSTDQQSILPVTCFLSTDIDPKKDPNKHLNHLIDMSGIIFDNIFSQKEWNEYETNWTKHTENNIKFYYKISRENIALTLQADELLKSQQ